MRGDTVWSWEKKRENNRTNLGVYPLRNYTQLHLPDLPRVEWVVESTRPMEHEPHARHLGDVPRVDVLVKAGLAVDEAAHVRDGADVPGRDWAESLPRRRGIADPRGKGVVE